LGAQRMVDDKCGRGGVAQLNGVEEQTLGEKAV
jgi:hypothetical protein